MERGSQFIRQWKLLAILSARRFGSTFEELAEELGYHQRTVRRDVEVMEAAGFPLTRERDPASRQVKLRLPDQYRAPNIPFSLMEVLSLYFSSNLLKSLKGTPMKEGIDTALQKIEKTLPVHVLDYVIKAGNGMITMTGPFKDYRAHVEKLSKVQLGIAERRKLEVLYRAYGRPKAEKHLYRPYCVSFTEGSFYIVGYSEQRAAMRMFLLERMERVTLRDEKFVIPQDFDPEEWLGESFGISHEEKTYDVKIQFAKGEAQHIKERQWHPTQKIQELRDGRVILSMKVTGLYDLARWVLSYGKGAKVLAPPELSTQVARHLKEAARQYE